MSKRVVCASATDNSLLGGSLGSWAEVPKLTTVDVLREHQPCPTWQFYRSVRNEPTSSDGEEGRDVASGMLIVRYGPRFWYFRVGQTKRVRGIVFIFARRVRLWRRRVCLSPPFENTCVLLVARLF